MIIDVPTHDDFETFGNGYLNLAWEKLSASPLEADDLDDIEERRALGCTDEELRRQQQRGHEADLRWAATTLVVVAQAFEFLIKGNIAEISPFLLTDPRTIANTASRLRKENNGRETAIPFSALRTHDIDLLLGIHNDIVAPTKRLSPGFKNDYETLRRERNRVAHVATRSHNLPPAELLRLMLRLYTSMHGNGAWIRLRKRSIVDDPNVTRNSEYGMYYEARYYSNVLPHLTREEAVQFLGVDNNSELHPCPNCLHFDLGGIEDQPRCAYRTQQDGCGILKCVSCDWTGSLSDAPCEHCGATAVVANDPEEIAIHRCVDCWEPVA